MSTNKTPLSLEQLRSMVGVMVWVEFKDSPEDNMWMFCGGGYKKENRRYVLMNDEEIDESCFSSDVIVYLNKPKRRKV